ncbi:MAG: hypothetical protein GJ676_21255 [Rhodobacteraceae bacterium]|nr:hypothetical protein [Paracoccaceae bacterium]
MTRPKRLLLRILAVALLGLSISACVPEPGTPEYEDYLRHKANREAVRYQGGP